MHTLQTWLVEIMKEYDVRKKEVLLLNKYAISFLSNVKNLGL